MPPSNGVPLGPLMAKCHSKISVSRGHAAYSSGVVCFAACFRSFCSSRYSDRIRRTPGLFGLYFSSGEDGVVVVVVVVVVSFFAFWVDGGCESGDAEDSEREDCSCAFSEGCDDPSRACDECAPPGGCADEDPAGEDTTSPGPSFRGLLLLLSSPFIAEEIVVLTKSIKESNTKKPKQSTQSTVQKLSRARDVSEEMTPHTHRHTQREIIK